MPREREFRERAQRERESSERALRKAAPAGVVGAEARNPGHEKRKLITRVGRRGQTEKSCNRNAALCELMLPSEFQKT